ncbi:MAG: hypothetical protein QOG64_566 [Acidimicrobiaceae bacterium]|nr:hypothetical protein [Acidimicrobiaceae bacterium]
MPQSQPTFVTRLDGPAVEQEVAHDMIRRGVLFLAPVLLLLGGLGWGWHGVASTGFSLALVLVNYALAAALLAWTARISLGLMMGAALFGYLLRLAIVTVAVLSVRRFSWVELWPLCLTLIVTHLGLLLWETRYVSASLAFPGLKPTANSTTSTKGR